ncbi:MAG: YbdK family carboxylate-amine ligase, partial [Actinomycetota bacterium]|nr:YbdK family carboxylate-amine ligase [Actinomycetota bacterium]
DWSLVQWIEEVVPRLSDELSEHVTTETHRSVVELRTRPHHRVGDAVAELGGLRSRLQDELEPMGACAAAVGTHPMTVWQETEVSSGERHQAVYGSMRELARREPTFALHVHLGVPSPEEAMSLMNRMRAHLPALLALSANSPYWQGRDTGLASARTPLFQAFPRVGIPRVFEDYDDYVETVDLLIRTEALAEHTLLWWDIRPQPPLGTVEVRIMDVQTTVANTAALAALVQSVARLELEEGFASPTLVGASSVLVENRFLAARDGIDARMIDPDGERRVPVREQVEDLLEACLPHARALGCADELASVRRLLERSGAGRQRALMRGHRARLPALLAALAYAFSPEEYAAGHLERRFAEIRERARTF